MTFDPTNDAIQQTVVHSPNGQPWLLGSAYFGGMATSVSYDYQTPTGVGFGVRAIYDENKKEISPALYVKYVKSKLGKVQIERVKRRLDKLKKLVAYSKEMGQKALFEELTKEVAILVRESELVALGIDSWVDKAHIEKFRHIVKEQVIKWETLEKFPRVIPKKVQTKIKQIQKAGIFDEYWILFIDYTKSKPIETTKEKIRNKDPIVFGRLKYQPDRYYFIADWVDEHCDLTLDKLIDKIRLDDKEFALAEIGDITKARWDNIVHEVRARVNRLEVTNAQNFRQLMEDEEKLQKELDERKDPMLESLRPPALPLSSKGERVIHWIPNEGLAIIGVAAAVILGIIAIATALMLVCRH